jgi:hypothetical protein
MIVKKMRYLLNVLLRPWEGLVPRRLTSRIMQKQAAERGREEDPLAAPNRRRRQGWNRSLYGPMHPPWQDWGVTALIFGGSVASSPHPSEGVTSILFPECTPQPRVSPNGWTDDASRTYAVAFPQRVTRYVKQTEHRKFLVGNLDSKESHTPCCFFQRSIRW